jgi:alkanesulfonate monooxygenase SsuD/methylene tetrahydromethanopterin reductase-like flavin-dependent oxidoreductase (luciferase family)
MTAAQSTLRVGAVVARRWDGDDDDWATRVRRATDLGYQLIGVGDSQSITMDVYVALAELAARTTVEIGPTVTNSETRHPAVTAGAIASIERLAPGRVFLGIGRGGSALDNIDRRPASVASFERYITCVRALLRGQPATFDGRALHSGWISTEIPILLSAGGPKILGLAGRIADGVIFTGSVWPEHVAAAVARVRDAAAEAGRSPDAVRFMVLSRMSVRDTREEAMADLFALLASAIHNLTPEDPYVPDDVRPRIEQLRRDYDASEHCDPSGVNVALLEEMGLLDYLADRYAIAGPPELCAQRVDELADVGVTDVVLAGSMRDPDNTIRRFATDVAPLARSVSLGT